jgi:flagellar FliL protein
MAESVPADVSEAPAVPAVKSSKTLVIVASLVLAATAAGGGAYWFLAQGDSDTAVLEEDGKAKSKKEAPKAPAIYVELDPPFVVNFEAKGVTRFLQVAIQVLTRDPSTAELVKLHDPVIRNDLLMLFGNQTYDAISTREGKEKLREEALQAVAAIVNAEGGTGKNIEQLYFTSFVMQ